MWGLGGGRATDWYHRTMTTYFISDMHLEEGKPALIEILLRFLRGPARSASALYILGDAFEVWIGDDHRTRLSGLVAEELRAVAASGVPVYFMHGNRDFLLGEQYAKSAGMVLLEDPTVREIGGVPTLLSHGDVWCTDDVAYTRFRAKSRTPAWQKKILSMPLFVRKALSAYARWKSMRHNRSNMTMQIGDVVSSEVDKAFAESGVRRIIHGHTHRPMVHRSEGRERVVIADWRSAGEAVKVNADGSIERERLE